MAVSAPPGGGYDLHSTWKSGANTTSFKVALANSLGTVLNSATVTAAAWDTVANVRAGSTLTVTVTPFNGKRRGTPVAKTVVTPDVTAPTGSFTGSSDKFDGVIHQAALADDVSANTAIKRTVNWGDGSSVQAWTADSDLRHTYAKAGEYVATVSLADEAGNTQAYQVSIVIKDQTAPTGSFTGSSQQFVGTIHQADLADDVSARTAITRTVDWGDSSRVERWTTDADLTHTYAAKDRYLATVTLADEAGNTRTYEVPIVIDDHTAPTASYSLSPATGWAKFTRVALTESAPWDDMSPTSALTRVVDWGDGTTSTWTGTDVPTHVYQDAKTFTPTVVVTDESGNKTAPISAGSTVITADVAGPTLKVSLPRKRVRASAASWKLVKGTATDRGVGVAKVSLRAVEKRTRGWYAYVPATKRWVRAGATQAAAFKRAKPAAAIVDAATGRWAAPLSGVSLGKLVYRVATADRVGNAAVTLTKTQAITRR